MSAMFAWFPEMDQYLVLTMLALPDTAEPPGHSRLTRTLSRFCKADLKTGLLLEI
jgi:hypothetical protein